ncbi:MAG: hypothetical protein ABI679_00750 [Gemmatimonadota bacterium]
MLAIRSAWTLAPLLLSIGTPSCLAAQRTATISDAEATAIAVTYDSLLSLGDPVGLDDLLAPDFTRQVLTDGQAQPVTQTRHAFLASITGSLGESDVTLARKRSPLVVRVKPVENEAEVLYTVTEQAVTPEGTGYVSTIETVLKLGVRGEVILVISLENRNRFKSRDEPPAKP